MGFIFSRYLCFKGRRGAKLEKVDGNIGSGEHVLEIHVLVRVVYSDIVAFKQCLALCMFCA